MKRSSTAVTSAEVSLTPAMYAILLSLASGPRHGLGIMDDVEQRTDGETVLPIGTLYRSIARLCEAGLIAPTRPRRRTAEDPRRNYYAITGAGRLAWARETERLDRLMRWARGLRTLLRPV
jgi:DNA-binding PadR family transcriptional regulator